MSYSPDVFVADEQPTTAKWNKLWTNDASFNDGTGIGDDAILNRHMSHGDDWAWASWSHNFAGFTGGTPTTVAAYHELGRRVDLRLRTTLGGTPSAVTNFTFNLPVEADPEYAINNAVNGNAIIKDANGGIFQAALYFASTTSMLIRLIDTATANGTISTPSTTTPMTWAVSDIVSCALSYEPVS